MPINLHSTHLTSTKIMKRLFALFAVLGLLVAARADVETYKIDPVHSSTGFTLRHILSKFTSSFTKTNGTITVDRDNLEKSSVEATVQIASVSTADPKRDGHIQSPDFFDAAKFPTATFKSKSWKKTGENTFDVTGDLTIKDVTKEVVFHVTSNGFAPGMKPGTTISGWEATTVIKKSEFGVAGPAMLSKALGDEVTLNISIEAGYAKA
jgi:polyisoprenoid-binding protein YceI